MTRKEAYAAMLQGKKVTHRFFSSDEYYYMVNAKIMAEDGVNHSNVFWDEGDGNFRADGWHIYSPSTDTTNA